MSSESMRMRRPFSGDTVADLHAQFAACDADGDGRIGYGEFEALLLSLGSGLSSVQRRGEFSLIDADNNGLIDLAEFRKWWRGG